MPKTFVWHNWQLVEQTVALVLSGNVTMLSC